jgi:hypothetical protein
VALSPRVGKSGDPEGGGRDSDWGNDLVGGMEPSTTGGFHPKGPNEPGSSQPFKPYQRAMIGTAHEEVAGLHMIHLREGTTQAPKSCLMKLEIGKVEMPHYVSFVLNNHRDKARSLCCTRTIALLYGSVGSRHRPKRI